MGEHGRDEVRAGDLPILIGVRARRAREVTVCHVGDIAAVAVKNLGCEVVQVAMGHLPVTVDVAGDKRRDRRCRTRAHQQCHCKC